MHEFSVMSQIIDSILSETKKRNARKVEQVDLELGEYTMLGEEQLKFAFEILAKDAILDRAKLVIKYIKGKIKCGCGYEGNVQVSEDAPHRIIPILECPRCKGAAEIVEGRECVLRNIRMVVPDV